MPSQNFFRSGAVNEIIRTVKKYPGIEFDKLIVKLGVNPPFIKETTARELIKSLIIDGQVKVNEDGEVYIC